MISRNGKSFLLLGCLLSGVITGMELHQGNCTVVLMNSTYLFSRNPDKRENCVLFYRDNNYTELLHKELVPSPMESTDWNDQKRGFLQVHLRDGSKLEIDVNRHLKNQ